MYSGYRSRGGLNVIHRSVAALALACFFSVANGQDNRTVPIETAVLPMADALKAASTAVTSCEAEGYRVAAIVLNTEGNIQVFLRGDGATSYAIDSARMKAYTLANLGPIRDTASSSGLANSILSSGNANPQLSNIPGMLLIGGAVMIVKDGKRVGVLGVAGAPGGQLDEACANDGIDAIR
jgi:uncharacterized protein GlcG (DUF336 family)